MADLNFWFADIKNLVNGDDRAKMTGKLGAWMFKVAALVPGQFSAVQIGWCTGEGRPSLGGGDILIYVAADFDQGPLAATGGNVSEAQSNSKVLGLTQVNSGQMSALSEIYWGRIISAQEAAGAAFHEAAHNKSQQGNEMHTGKDGLLKSAPSYGSDPTPANLDFFAKNVLAQIRQVNVPQSTLKKFWYA